MIRRSTSVCLSAPRNDAACAMSSHVSDMVDEFFKAPASAVTNHEEWILRQAAVLMLREAHVVSVLERTAGFDANEWRMRASEISTRHCMGTGATASNES